MQVQLLLIAGAVVSLALAWGLSLRDTKVSYRGRWICFDEQNNAYLVRDFRAPGRLEQRVNRQYSVDPWRSPPAYLLIPDDFGKTEATIVDGWPWPCLAKHQGARAMGTVPARYEHVVDVGKYQFPALPLWGRLTANSLFWAGTLGAVWLGWRLGRGSVRRWRRRCTACGYSLRGLVGAVPCCPECGRSL